MAVELKLFVSIEADSVLVMSTEDEECEDGRVASEEDKRSEDKFEISVEDEEDGKVEKEVVAETLSSSRISPSSI